MIQNWQKYWQQKVGGKRSSKKADRGYATIKILNNIIRVFILFSCLQMSDPIDSILTDTLLLLIFIAIIMFVAGGIMWVFRYLHPINPTEKDTDKNQTLVSES